MKLTGRIKEKVWWWQQRLQPYVQRPAFTVFIAAVAALNHFIPFFPVELFVALRVLPRPKEWWRIGLLAVGASLVGAACLMLVVQSQPQEEITAWLARHVGGEQWDQISHLVTEYGAAGAFLISVSFLPLPPAIIVCVLTKVPFVSVLIAVGIGHCLKYGLFAGLAAFSPRWFSRSA